MSSIEDERNQSRNEFRTFLKSLKERDIITKKSFNWYAEEEKKWNERRKRVSADSDEDEEDELMGVKAKVSSRRGNNKIKDEVKVTSRAKFNRGRAAKTPKAKGKGKRKAPARTPGSDDEDENNYSRDSSIEDSEKVPVGSDVKFSSLKERLKKKMEE